MDELWNDSLLQPPPTCSVRTHVEPTRIKELGSILKEAVCNLNITEVLYKEAALVSRLLYKVKICYRHDKWTQALCKILKCIRTLKTLNMPQLMSNFNSTLPGTTSTKYAYLPTLQMYKYLLLRIQTLAKLLLRIKETCEVCGEYIWLRLRLGWNLQVLLLSFCIISRIWTVTTYLIKQAVSWYNQLYPFLDCFTPTIPYLENYIFVKNLKDWLGDILEKPKKTQSKVGKFFTIINLESDDELIPEVWVSDSEMDVDMIKDVKIEVEDVVVLKTLKRTLDEDIGEQISRSVKISPNKGNKKKIKMKKKKK